MLSAPFWFFLGAMAIVCCEVVGLLRSGIGERENLALWNFKFCQGFGRMPQASISLLHNRPSNLFMTLHLAALEHTLFHLTSSDNDTLLKTAKIRMIKRSSSLRQCRSKGLRMTKSQLPSLRTRTLTTMEETTGYLVLSLQPEPRHQVITPDQK